jgi:hypothetical protein
LVSVLLAVSAAAFQFIPLQARAIAVLVIALSLAILEVVGRPPRLPSRARQVPRLVSTYDNRFGPFSFGFEMGTGVRTYATSTLPHIAVISLTLLGTLFTAAAVAIGFAAGRACLAWLLVRADASLEWWARLKAQSSSIARVSALGVSGGIAAVVARSF